MAAPEDEPAGTWTDLVWDELRWLLRTLGIISLSLAIGRVLTVLTKMGGIDLNVLRGDWQSQVEQSLKKRNHADDDKNNNEENEW